jgi:heterodisulfide reductase subunit C
MGVKPYPQKDFDINLSEMDNGFLVEIGSKKGQKIVEENSSLFQGANDSFISRRDEKRKKVSGEVKSNIKENGIPGEELFDGIIERNYESDIWSDEARACVECGACTAICPTCHCFLLYDQKDEERMMRLRMWDSCMIKDYARVGGGSNPRPKLYMRLRNRFEKKFDFFPKVAEVYACTGCGRCVSACPAKIDIREVLKKLVASNEKK